MRKNSTNKNTSGDRKEADRGTFTTLKIADIAVREDWQVRNKIDHTTVNTYKNIYKNGGTLPPIRVALVGGALRLVDGWHRREALMLLGRTEVEAIVFEATMSGARWEAASSNLTHGLPLKPKEVRKVFNAYVTSRQHYKANGNLKSYRDMEADLNNRVSHRTLNRWMEMDHPKVAKAMSKRYGGSEEMARYHDGDAAMTDWITPLQTAIGNIDNALAEGRTMKPKDRRELLDHLRRATARLATLPQWTSEEIGEGLHVLPDNPDF